MKTLLILHPYKFTEFDVYKHELLYLEKRKDYKFKFLTYKNSKPTKPNYKIIKDLMDQLT